MRDIQSVKRISPIVWIGKPKLDRVENRDVLEREKNILSHVPKLDRGCVGMVLEGYKFTEFFVKIRSAIAADNVGKGDSFESRMMCHFDACVVNRFRTPSRWRFLTIETPLDVGLMTEDLLLALEPERHLRVLILMVGCVICILCEVDVETFGCLGIVVVCCAIKLDCRDVMLEGMEFREVES